MMTDRTVLSFVQQIIIECLLCARHCRKVWDSSQNKKDACPCGGCKDTGRDIINKIQNKLNCVVC